MTRNVKAQGKNVVRKHQQTLGHFHCFLMETLEIWGNTEKEILSNSLSFGMNKRLFQDVFCTTERFYKNLHWVIII